MVHPNLMKVGRTREVYCVFATKQFSRPLLTVTNLPSQNGASGRCNRSAALHCLSILVHHQQGSHKPHTKCHVGLTSMVHVVDTPDQWVTVESSLLWKSCLRSVFTSKLVSVSLRSLRANPLGILSKQMALTVIQSLRYQTLLIVWTPS